MSSKRFPKTMDKIRELFPDNSHVEYDFETGAALVPDSNKSLRHELYVFIHDIPLGNAPVQSNVQDFEFSERDLTHKEYLKLVEVNKVYADERAALQSLPEFVAKLVEDKTTFGTPFSAFEITELARNLVNNSAIALLNDRDYEDLEIVQGSGVTGLTQKIPHSEVRAILNDLFESGKMRRYEKVRTGKYFTYRPMASQPFVACNKQSGIFKAVPGTQEWRDAIGQSPDPFKDSAMARSLRDQKDSI